jgi:hypothetical protein
VGPRLTKILHKLSSDPNPAPREYNIRYDTAELIKILNRRFLIRCLSTAEFMYHQMRTCWIIMDTGTGGRDRNGSRLISRYYAGIRKEGLGKV